MAIRFGNEKTEAAFNNGEFGCFMVGSDNFGRIAIAFRWDLAYVSEFGPTFEGACLGDLADMRAIARMISDRRGLKRVRWVRDVSKIKEDCLVIEAANDIAHIHSLLVSV